MTAGGGIVHEEFHSEAFGRSGGRLHAVQLWVNLPGRHKMTPPTYQTLLAADIPLVQLPEQAGSVRVIAGEFDGQRGPARTFSPVDLWDVRLQAGHRTHLALAAGRTAAVVILSGSVRVNGERTAGAAQLVLLDREAGTVGLEALQESALLVLSGEPLNEPVVGYGPFVMTSRAEILQAIEDFNAGRFGQIPPRELPESKRGRVETPA
jgi:hypothetical protein